MFEGITKGLKGALSFIERSRLTESNIHEGLGQVREALLEADVNFDVANDFIDRVSVQAVGDRVLKSIRPSEQIVGIVHQELVELMGPVDASLPIQRDGLTVLMLCGLQGSGKTTTCGKLARMLKEQGHLPMLVAADLQRPAAIDQLQVIAEQIAVPCYTEPATSTPLSVCQNGLKEAKRNPEIGVVILDTAGRLHVDDELMGELEQLDRRIQPHQVLLVCDAMTGQDAVNSAKAFNDALEVDGVILTKLDGDTRGGAALSVKAVTGVPIKFIGVGEQLDRLEEFRPEGMADRILGMGDVVGLVQRAQEQIDTDEALAQQQKMMDGKFTLEDFRKQMRMMRKMGPMREIMKMIPGVGGMVDDNPDMENPEEDLRRIEGMIDSMTPHERNNPERIDRSRRNRIAKGSGNPPSEVNNLLKQFDAMSGMMQQMAGMGVKDRMRAVKEMSEGGMLDPGAQVRKEKTRSKRGSVDRDQVRNRKRQQRKNARKARKRNRR
ncbi:MAG: signal recognition particle protein [Planctomycetaceae bacterium]|jgi:signal recognition particle subunit SRP54|nr:signal recognition particle protein [Planctomycetaceae bacterium]